MKTTYFLALIIATFGLFTSGFAQTDPCDSVNTDLSSKFRVLGNWDENGIPDYLQSSGDDVSQALLDYVNEIAPEGEDLHESSPEYFSEETQLNTVITKTTDVYLTFVHEGAGWKNTLGFYTYPVGNAPQTIDEIDSLTFIFPNVSQETSLVAGDKVHLGKFEAGTVIGYFLMAKGWTGSDACLNSNAHFVFTDKHLNTYTTAEFQQQTILLNYKQENLLLLGIEDIRRPEGDQDFNDAVFYLTSDPIGIDTTNVPEVATANISGDFILCEGESADLTIDLTGKGPWNVIFSNGTDTIVVNDIPQNSYIHTTTTPGNYSIIEMEDALGRGIISGSASIINATPDAEFVSLDASVCAGESTSLEVQFNNPIEAAITLVYTNGTESFTIEGISGESYTIEALEAGTYELVSVSNGSCEKELSVQAVITELTLPLLSLQETRCVSSTLAVIELSVEGGEAPYTLQYSFNGEITTLNSSDPGFSIEVNTNGNFEIISIENASCTGSSDFSDLNIDCLDYINQTSIDTSPTSCLGEELILGLNISELITIESISWSSNGQGSIMDPQAMSTVYIPSTNETGMIEFTVNVQVNGEMFTVTRSVEILGLPEADFYYSPETIFTGDMVVFTAENTEYDSYIWYVEDEEYADQEVTHVFEEAGIYQVTLSVVQGECYSELTREVEVLLRNALFVPNVFNPVASNPESRVVKVYGNNIVNDEFSFRIFNRWGNEVYATNSFVDANQNGWNGANQNNEDQSLSSFSYILKGSFEDGTRINKTGTITLVR